jgi:DNA repair exonuclease SbcCD ATPase subunit
VESLLSFAEELERRDADVAQALTRMEALQAEVEELRTHATAAASFLVTLPPALAERASDERVAVDARDEAQHAAREAEQLVERAEKEEQRLEAARALHRARDDLHAAEFWVAQARDAHAELERQGVVRRAETEQLARRAVELAPRVRDVPALSPDSTEHSNGPPAPAAHSSSSTPGSRESERRSCGRRPSSWRVSLASP